MRKKASLVKRGCNDGKAQRSNNLDYLPPEDSAGAETMETDNHFAVFPLQPAVFSTQSLERTIEELSPVLMAIPVLLYSLPFHFLPSAKSISQGIIKFCKHCAFLKLPFRHVE